MMEKQLPKIVERISIISLIIFWGCVIGIFVCYHIFAGLPTAPVPGTGEVVPFDFKGVTRYITFTESFTFRALWVLALITFALPAYVFWRTRKTLTWRD